MTDPERLITGLVGMGRAESFAVRSWMKEQVLKVIRDRIAELLVKNRWPLLDVTSGAYTEELERDVLKGLSEHSTRQAMGTKRPAERDRWPPFWPPRSDPRSSGTCSGLCP